MNRKKPSESTADSTLSRSAGSPFATKSDLRAAVNRLVRWILGVAIVVGLAGLMVILFVLDRSSR